MILGSAHYINALNLVDIPRVSVYGNDIHYVSVIRNLGIYITLTLNWREQVTQISNRVSKTLYQLRLGRVFLSIQLKKMLVCALIFPILDYCSLVFADISEIESIRLQRLLNSCVRFILGIRKSDHITPYFTQLRWLKVKDRRKYFLDILFYQILHLGYCPWLRKILVSRESVVMTLMVTRSDLQDLAIPPFRTATYEHSVVITGIRLWNSLPLAVKLAPSLFIFKNSLYEHLLSNTDT